MHNCHCPPRDTLHSAFCILHEFLVLGLSMVHFSPVQVTTLQAHDEHFGAGQVGGDGHIVLVAMADGLDHLGVIPGIHIVRIRKEQHQIDLIVSDPGVDLLMATLLMGKQQGNGQAECAAHCKPDR